MKVRRQKHTELVRTPHTVETVLPKNIEALFLPQPGNMGVFGNGATDLTQSRHPLVIGSDGSDGSDGNFQDKYDIRMLHVDGDSGTGRLASIVSHMRP